MYLTLKLNEISNNKSINDVAIEYIILNREIMSILSNLVCPSEIAGILDNRIRRIFQEPEKILGPYVKKGMTVVDLGCGPGYFSISLATMVGNSGKVIAADLQERMLKKVVLFNIVWVNSVYLPSRISLYSYTSQSLIHMIS